MEITKEILAERIENLTAQREQLIANINAVNGAVGTLQQLIKDLEKEDAVDDDGN